MTTTTTVDELAGLSSRRALGAAALVYVAAWLIGLATAPSAPSSYAADTTIQAFYADNGSAALLQATLVHAIAGVALAVFVVALARHLDARNTLVMAAGLGAAAVSLVQYAMEIGLNQAADAGSYQRDAVSRGQHRRHRQARAARARHRRGDAAARQPADVPALGSRPRVHDRAHPRPRRRSVRHHLRCAKRGAGAVAAAAPAVGRGRGGDHHPQPRAYAARSGALREREPQRTTRRTRRTRRDRTPLAARGLRR
jgi:hypothetical protein